MGIRANRPLAAGVILAALVVASLGACSSSSPPTKAAGPTTTAGPKGPPPCWAGAWELIAGSENLTVAGDTVAVSGGIGTQLALGRDLKMFENFGTGTPLKGTGPRGALLAQRTGIVQYKPQVMGPTDKGGTIVATVTTRTGITAISYNGTSTNQRDNVGAKYTETFLCTATRLIVADPSRNLHQIYRRATSQ